jgi:hypothetical protein
MENFNKGRFEHQFLNKASGSQAESLDKSDMKYIYFTVDY